jgi:hypothetical protein
MFAAIEQTLSHTFDRLGTLRHDIAQLGNTDNDILVAVTLSSEIFAKELLAEQTLSTFNMILTNTPADACDALVSLVGGRNDGESARATINVDDQVRRCAAQVQSQLGVDADSMQTLCDRVANVHELTLLGADQLIAYIGIDVASADRIDTFSKLIMFDQTKRH